MSLAKVVIMSAVAIGGTLIGFKIQSGMIERHKVRAAAGIGRLRTT